MAKKESTFFNMIVALFAVTFFSAVALGSVYERTKGPIEQVQRAKSIAAIKKVLPEFTNNPLAEMYTINSEGFQLRCYPAKKNGKLVGTAVETFSNKGFAGQIKLMVGLLPDGTIYNVAVVEQKETPGLGDKMEPSKSDFLLQFKGKNPAHFILRVKKDGGDVDAITAATISSRAVCDAIQRAFNAYKEKVGLKS